ncbi:MAG TPA: DUF1080 domain-containing protein [Methylomirabilota bacterium]|nr:DUF1080 domain-containing protein [Methylomirabilota bacterium]
MNKLTLRSLCSLGLALGTALATNAAEGNLGYKDTAKIPGTDWHIHDGDRPQPRIVKPGESFSDMAKAPADAIVLFDGKDFSKWLGQGGAEPKWKIENGYMETTPKGGRIRTKDEFSDFQLHLEFATPEKVEGSGQGRGNNGVSIFGKFEIQILDSYENKTYPDGQAAAMYGQRPPLVNASRGPGQWQTYDIIFEAPRFNESGELTKKANVTVIHNGVVVHHKQDFFGPTTHRAIQKYSPKDTKGPIDLYEHGNPVRFRNIWIRPLGEYDKP